MKNYMDKLKEYKEKQYQVLIELDSPEEFTGGIILDFGEDFIEVQYNQAITLISMEDVLKISYRKDKPRSHPMFADQPVYDVADIPEKVTV